MQRLYGGLGRKGRDSHGYAYDSQHHRHHQGYQTQGHLYDLTNAYYQVIREMAPPLGADDTELMDKLDTYGIPRCLVGAVHMLLQNPALTDETCPPHLLSLQVQAHMGTWILGVGNT